MRKLIPILVALIVGAAIGFGSSELRWHVRTLPYCQLAQNAELYHLREIRVKARVGFGAHRMYIYEDCDPNEALGSAVEYEGDPAFPNIADPTLRSADAVIDGVFNAHYSMGCWGPKFHIAARKIEVVSPVQSYVPIPIYNEDGMRIKH
jgi:hypothetical protein